MKNFGAVGDGCHDDQTAIAAAITSAKCQGKGVYFPSGTYVHSDIIRVTGAVTLLGTGNCSVLSASNKNCSAVDFEQSSGGASQLAVTCPSGSGCASQNAKTAGVLVRSSCGVTVSQVTVNSGFSCGVLIVSSSNVKVTCCSINPTDGDGVAVNNSKSVTISQNTISGNSCRVERLIAATADWGNSSSSSQSLNIQSNSLSGDVTRGIIEISSATGSNITSNTIQFSGNQNSCADGIYIHTNDTCAGESVDSLYIRGNKITNASRYGIHIVEQSSGTPRLGSIAMDQNTICGSTNAAARVETSKNRGGLGTLRFASNTVSNTCASGFTVNGTFGNLLCQNNQFSSTGKAAIHVVYTGDGCSSLNISNNCASNANGNKDAAGAIVIRSKQTQGNLPSLTCKDNNYSGSDPKHVIYAYDDRCQMKWPSPPAVFSGNQSNPPYPSVF